MLRFYLLAVSAEWLAPYEFTYYEPEPNQKLLVDKYGDYLMPQAGDPTDMQNAYPSQAAFEYIKHIDYSFSGAGIESTQVVRKNINDLPGLHIFDATKTGNAATPYYMLKSMRYPTGATVSYKYRNSTDDALGRLPNPFHLSNKVYQDILL